MKKVWSLTFICYAVLEYLRSNKQLHTRIDVRRNARQHNTSDERCFLPDLKNFPDFVARIKAYTFINMSCQFPDDCKYNELISNMLKLSHDPANHITKA